MINQEQTATSPPKISLQVLKSQGKECLIIRELADQVSRFTHINLPTFIYGGSGVGKRTIARLLHEGSTLSEWIELDVETNTTIEYFSRIIEKALSKNSHTIYIPNIEKLSLELQDKLSGLVSHHDTSHSRVIISSKENIFLLLQKSKISPQLFTLFSSLPIELPTIENSPEYREAIINWYLSFLNKRITADIPSVWPENIRSVRSFIEQQ